MDGFLRQSTASQTRAIGPFIDSSDFITAKTALTIANTDIKISKAGAALASKNSGGGTADALGWYDVTWDATDTATVGELKYSVKVAGALVVFGSYWVLEEAVYDALFAASAPGYLQPTVAARTLDVSATGEAGVDWANVGSPTTALDLSGTTIKTTQKVDVDTIKTQAVTAAAGVTFPSSIASPTNITAGTITTATNLTNAPSAGDFTATMKTSIGTAVAASAVASVTGNVGGNVTGSVGSVVGAVGSVTGNVGGNVTGSVGSVATGGIAAASFAAGAIDAAAIAADAIGASEIAADAIGSSELATSAATEIAGKVWDEATSGHTTADTYGDKFGAHLPGVLKAVIGTGSTTTSIVLSTIDGAAPSATDDFFNGAVLIFTSGALKGQRTSVSDYTGATTTLTVVAVTGNAANGVTAILV